MFRRESLLLSANISIVLRFTEQSHFIVGVQTGRRNHVIISFLGRWERFIFCIIWFFGIGVSKDNSFSSLRSITPEQSWEDWEADAAEILEQMDRRLFGLGLGSPVLVHSSPVLEHLAICGWELEVISLGDPGWLLETGKPEESSQVLLQLPSFFVWTNLKSLLVRGDLCISKTSTLVEECSQMFGLFGKSIDFFVSKIKDVTRQFWVLYPMGDVEWDGSVVETKFYTEETSDPEESESEESESDVRTEEEETIELESEFSSFLVEGGNWTLSNTSFTED
jgi:hypothetical protein